MKDNQNGYDSCHTFLFPRLTFSPIRIFRDIWPRLRCWSTHYLKDTCIECNI